MAEDNIEQHNRWERVAPHESSHIAQFAAEFELASSILPKEASEIHESLTDLLYVGLRRDMTYSQLIKHYSNSPEAYRYGHGGLFFREVRDLEDRPLKAMLGVVREGEVFVTNRVGWDKSLNAPKIEGFKRNNKSNIQIVCNFDAETDYNYVAIPGTNLSRVIVDEEGDITGMTRGGERKELSQIQKVELVKMLKEVKERAVKNWERTKEVLAKTQSASSSQ